MDEASRAPTLSALRFLSTQSAAKINSTDFAVYTAIALHADKNFEAWPSIARIAEFVHASKNTVRGALSRLEEASLLHVEKRQRGNGSHSSHLYTLIIPDIETTTEATTAEPSMPARDEIPAETPAPPPDRQPRPQPTRDGQFKMFAKIWPYDLCSESELRRAWQEYVTDDDIATEVVAGVRKLAAAKARAKKRSMKGFPTFMSPAKFIAEKRYALTAFYGVDVSDKYAGEVKIPRALVDHLKARMRKDGIEHLPDFLRDLAIDQEERTRRTREYIGGQRMADGTKLAL